MRLIIDNNPHIPSRSMAYEGIGPSPIEEMIESCKKLEEYPSDIIAIPCNSASYFIPAVQKEIDIPILNIVEITARQIKSKVHPGSRIAVLGGRITYNEKLYKQYIEREGFTYIDHNEEAQTTITSFIEAIKKGSSLDNELFSKFLAEYSSIYKPDAIILGCTEFSCLENIDNPTRMIIIDSSTELARHIVNLAYGHSK